MGGWGRLYEQGGAGKTHVQLIRVGQPYLKITEGGRGKQGRHKVKTKRQNKKEQHKK